MSTPLPTNLKSIDDLRSYGLEAVIDRARLPRPGAERHFDFNLVLKIRFHNGQLNAELRPLNKSFDIDDLSGLSIAYQREFLSETRRMHFGATPEGVPNNGISVAADVLERLPNHSVSMDQECKIIIETNCDELQPKTFDTGLYCIFQALANMKPSNHAQYLPIIFRYYSKDPDCWSIKIMGIAGFDVRLRIFPNEGRRRPFTPSERSAIEKIKDGLYDSIPRRLKSSQSPFATLPVEIIHNIAASFVPADIRISKSTKTIINVVMYRTLDGEVFTKLCLLHVDKRLRKIILDMLHRRTHVKLEQDFPKIRGTFRSSLDYAQQYFVPGFFKNVQHLTFDIWLPSDGVRRNELSSDDVTWNVVHNTESRSRLRNVWYLLALRPPTSFPAQYSITSIMSQLWGDYGSVRGIHNIEIQIGSVKTRIEVSFFAKWRTWMEEPSATECDQMREEFEKAVDAIIAPMVEQFASSPYASGPEEG